MPIKILMVCLGNICRSPLAEGILQNKFSRTQILVDSAGTANYHIGKPPDTRSIAVAKNNQIDISKQRCKQIQSNYFDYYDVIYTMDSHNYADVCALAPTKTAIKKVQLLLSVVPNSTHIDVPDPFYGNEEDFTTVYNIIDNACTILAEQL